MWTDDSLKVIRENFVAAAVPTQLCRAEGPEGEFLRMAGIDKRWVTSNGYMSCVSASGVYLGDRPTEKALEAFRKLPEADRKPEPPRELEPSERKIPAPPPGGLVLRVHGRFLSREPDGRLRYARLEDFPLTDGKSSYQKFLEPNTECMWITEAEWKALVPSDPVKGMKVVVPPSVVERIARFHLTPRRSMTSEGHGLGKAAVKEAVATLAVDDVSPERIRMLLEGSVRTGADYVEAEATSPNGPLRFGFASPLRGILEVDRKTGAFVRFDVVASGEVWGRWGDANGKSLFVERPGRTPFAYAFELATGDSPADRIPPGGNGAYVAEKTGYFGR
ncbi:MAG TPA: hypothetical protein VF950_27245 [Planctomycetota bacterium]